MEYVEAFFNINDSVFGSCFYMATGFHGFHVFIGTCCLIVSLLRIVYNHLTSTYHFGFESAAWYWHFVDVVWLFLFYVVFDAFSYGLHGKNFLSRTTLQKS